MIKQNLVDKLTPLKTALKLNREMQTALKDEITKLKQLLAMNQEKQEILKKVLYENKSSSKSEKQHKATMPVFATPYFQDLRKMVPPPNEDTIAKIRNYDVNAYLTCPRPWTSAEYEMLREGVIEYALLYAQLPFKRQRDHIKRKMEDKDVTAEEMEELNDELYIAEQKIRLVNHKPLDELLLHVDGNIDWMTVSSTKMQGVRTADECEIMWNNFLSFKINKGAFNKQEDSKLIDLAEDYKGRNWDEIAAALKTNRTAIQCFERYLTKWSSNLKRKYWTKEEDDHLMRLVEEHKCEETIPWTKISSLMEGRTNQQVAQRYNNFLQRCNYAPWSPEEDGLLITLYQKYGAQWKEIKSYFKRRSSTAIRDRYCNSLKPDLKIGLWSLEEDKLLISMIKKYSYGQWTQISKKVPGRTDSQCLQRAQRLLEWSVDFYSNRGTEYDPGIYDPELFAKILRPLPHSRYPSSNSKKFNSRRKSGLERLVKALEVVSPEYKAGIQDINSINLSWMSLEMLDQLSEVLQADLPETKPFKKEDPVHPPKYITKVPVFRKREEPESDEENYVQLPENTISEQERDSIDSALDIMLQMQGEIMPPLQSKANDFSANQCAEMSLYKAYLYQQFHCKALCDKEDDLENVVFDNVDYGETLQTVVSYFIQPPVYDNQFIVCTPNLTTMTGMETVEATENRLRSMAKCMHHSTSYVEYLCGKRKASPECLQCLCRSGKVNGGATPESVMSDMKEQSFLLDERLENSACVESASAEQLSESCVCKVLSNSQKSVQLLRKRFLSLFLWPALMSAVGFSEEQEQITCMERGKSQNYFLNLSTCPMKCQGISKRKKRTDREKQATKKLKSEELTFGSDL